MLLGTYGQVQEALEPACLKMKEQRYGKRTGLILAETGESLSWQDRDADDKLKKQKPSLMKSCIVPRRMWVVPYNEFASVRDFLIPPNTQSGKELTDWLHRTSLKTIGDGIYTGRL